MSENKSKRQALHAEAIGFHNALSHPKFNPERISGVATRFNRLVEEIAGEFGSDYKKFALSPDCELPEYVSILEALLNRLELDDPHSPKGGAWDLKGW